MILQEATLRSEFKNQKQTRSIESVFLEKLVGRRSARRFSKISDPALLADYRERVITCIRAAGTAPSGANRQPWFFALVESAQIKRDIRVSAELVEKDFYLKTAPASFLDALEPLGTFWQKPHLEEASFLVVIFSKMFNDEDGVLQKCYYPHESVGIATGFLISSLHLAGFDLLTHTPQPMKFLNQTLNRPDYERPFLILAIGKKLESYSPPKLEKKSIHEIMKIY